MSDIGLIPETLHIPIVADPAAINIWSVDRDYRYSFFNDNHRSGMKEVWNADISLGSCLLNYITSPEYRLKVKANYDAIFSGESHRSIDRLKTNDGREKYYENFGSPMFDVSGAIIGGNLYTIDITQRIELETDLKQKIALLQSIMNSPEGVIIFSIDTDYKYLFFNNAHREAMRDVWRTEPVLGACVLDLLPDPEHRSRVKSAYDQALRGEGISTISAVIDVAGKRRYHENISAPIKNGGGRITGLTIFVLDITDRVLAEQKIKDALFEKELLLKEIHHRVKNNLMIITSMLNLQMGMMTDETMRQVLKDSQNRINTMALIHQALYQGASLARIQMKEYLEPLISSILGVYSPDDKRIDFDLDVADVQLDIDQAIPAGLIVNELLTNSIKYAFVGKGEGRIWIKLAQTDSGGVHLRVKDDGPGLPSGFDAAKSNGLGMQLITALVDQLGGTIFFESAGGLSAEIRF